MSAIRLALAACLALAGLNAAPARAFDLPIPDPNDYCTTGWVIEALKKQVDYKFRGYTETKLFLTDVINPSEHYSRERDETRNVARKWCHAKGRMNDGVTRDIWYIIEYPWGFAGAPLSAMEFCISGLDPWKIYGKDCSTIRNAIGW